MKRVSTLILILCACLVSVAWGQQWPGGKCYNNWTEFHRTNMERWNPHEHTLNVHNVGRLGLKWSYATEQGANPSPAVVNGALYIGSANDILDALSASTGALLWSYGTNNSGGSPAVANGVVYVGSFENNLYALNAGNGTLLWSFTTGSHVEGSPTVIDGVVYFGSDDNNVYALDAKTGAKLWSYTTNDDDGSSPAIVNGVVYVGSYGGTIYAFGLKKARE